MKRSELTEFAVEEEGFKLKIRRGANGLPLVSSSYGSNAPFNASSESASATPSPAPTAAQSSSTPVPAADEAGIGYIKSPMVGTFYRSASPESKPYAEAGTKVVENGQPVEYGQKLFKVKLG